MHKLKSPAYFISRAMAPPRMSADVSTEGIRGGRKSEVLAPGTAGTDVVESEPKAMQEPKPRFSRILWTSLKDGLLLFNPKSVYAKVKEVKDTFRQARSIRDPEIAGNSKLISAKMMVKFGAALAVSEVIGPYVGAPLLGMLAQEMSKNAYWGVAGTIVGDYLPAVLSFEVAWLALNAGYYANSAKSLFGKFRAFYKDVIPIHAVLVVCAAIPYVLGGALNSLLIAGLNSVAPHLAEKIHVLPFITEMTNGAIAQTIYLTLVGNKAMDIIKKVTSRYAAYLEKTFGKTDTAGST